MERLLIKNARAIVTCDDDRRVLREQDIAIEGPVIRKIGKDLDWEGAHVIDASGHLVYPGLVNLHHHFYQILTRNIPEIQSMELFDWLTWLYERWRLLTPDRVYASSLAALGELARHGCTTTVDHHYVFPRGQGNLIDRQFEAADRLGMRLHACRGSMSRGVSAGGLPPDELVQSPQAILEDSERLIDTYHDSGFNAMRQVILAPCSPFSVDEDLLVASAELARRKGVRLHTHLAETRDEDDYCRRVLGLRPLAYMERVGWVGPDVFFAHGVHFNDRELETLAETGTGVAHCPVSNLKLSSGIARITDMLALGVPVGLAVDGSASNDGNNMIEELRTGYLLQRLQARAQAPAAADWLWMATRGGAAILGRKDIGSLEEGKCADLFMVSSRRLGMAGCMDDPAAIPATVGFCGPVDLTLVGGKIVQRHGLLARVDETALVEEIDGYAQEMR